MGQYYSELKAAWHIDRIAQLRAGEQIAPVELQFILSDLCNQACHFCAYRAEAGLSSEGFVEWEDGKRNHNPNRMIGRDKALEILDDAARMGVRSIIFTGGGEPTVHPNHLEIFQHALDLGLECSLNTNGILLRKGWEEVLSRFTYVRFSIDAGTADEYAAIRRVPSEQYQCALTNLAQVVEVCALRSCVVGAGYVVTPENYKNLVEGVRAIRATQAQYVRLASMQSTAQGAPFAHVLSEVHHYLHLAKGEATSDFEVIDLFDLVLGRTPAESLCGMQHFVLYIGGNLRVYRCCYTAYTQLGEIGDLREQSFGDWFKSTAKKEAIATFDARACAVCPLEHKNETIRYMVNQNPSHVNFV
ncbi:hypothetical protein LCGC14_0709770 [marine sediment metagenome]|uniref:Radical SAM core domain-containing protein n=1 Tax=marine sediment metagenome TaxID=412755 RepID=A0A0F9R0W1_9ZZZZ